MNVTEPRVVLYYIERAEALLAETSMAVRDRDKLAQLLGQTKALAAAMDITHPVEHGDMT
jgi:hypothetical protein